LKTSTDALAKIPLFSRVPKRDLKHLADRVREERFRPGVDIVTQGQAGGRMFVITSGSAKVVVNGRTVRRLGVGSLIGELSVFDRSPRTATVHTETEVAALSLSSVEFLAVLDEQPSIARSVMQTMADRLRSIEKTL
jgi:CRP-like cAMP-binding protein